MISENPENIMGLWIPCAMQNDGGIQLGKLQKLQRMVQIKWRSSLGSIICSSQLCMLFIAIYLAMQIKYILLARFRFGAGKNRVSACPCAAAHWRLRLHLCVGFLNFFREKTHFMFKLALCISKLPFVSDFQFDNGGFQFSFDCFGSSFETTSCFFLSSAHQLGRAAPLPEGFLAEPWASKGSLPLTEANVALGVRESLCIPCCYDIFHLLQPRSFCRL